MASLKEDGLEARSRIRVVLADDHPIFREGLARVIKLRPDLELVGECEDGSEALRLIRDLEPAVAVLDLRMPGLDGLAVLNAVERDGLPTRVVFLSAIDDAGTVYQAVAAGAAGYLSKESGRDAVCDAIAAVGRGGTVIGSDVQGGLVSQIRRQEAANRPLLTQREQEVLVLMARGMSAPDMAEHLILSPATVRSHIQTLYEKLSVSDRAAAVATAMRQGLIE